MFWKAIAWVVSRQPVANWIIARAQATPYFHLDGYMSRWWLFNGYPPNKETEKKWKWLPSIRIHHILREDRGRDLHNHPWDARTIIMKGGYKETRLIHDPHGNPEWPEVYDVKFSRTEGDTATLSSDDFHTIEKVSEGGVWTMFITYKYQQKWGFMTEKGFVPHDQYEGVP